MRKALLITKEEFAKHLEEFNDKYRMPYDSKVVEKDIDKVQFDWENHDVANVEDPITVLENGLPVCFMWAGGDWETAVNFILYWNGKEMRGYIPKDGNPYDKKHNIAYGNGYDVGEEDLEDDDPALVADFDAMKKDIINRIEIV